MNTRPATAADLPALDRLYAHQAGPGAAARAQLPQAEHEHLLLTEDPASGDLLASVRLRPRIGIGLPRYWYHVGCTVHAAPELQLFHRQGTLLLGNDHTGAAELCDWAWASQDRTLDSQAAALQRVLQAALQLARQQRAALGPQLVVELPGLRDSAGQSPFWQGLGRHFYRGDPLDAEAKHGADWPSHVAALLPRHPVLTAFLPEVAQAAMAQVAPRARLLRELLEAAGLRYSHHIRIHDGGPVLQADLDHLGPVTAGG